MTDDLTYQHLSTHYLHNIYTTRPPEDKSSKYSQVDNQLMKTKDDLGPRLTINNHTHKVRSFWLFTWLTGWSDIVYSIIVHCAPTKLAHHAHHDYTTMCITNCNAIIELRKQRFEHLQSQRTQNQARSIRWTIPYRIIVHVYAPCFRMQGSGY